MSPQIMTIGVKECHPHIWGFGMLIVLRCRHLENSRCRESLSLNSYLSKDGYSKGNKSKISSLGGFINQGRLTFIPGKGT